MKIFRILFISISLFSTSCSTITSSVHYTKGTEFLEAGDYNNAVIELEKAIEIDPSCGRNYNNLSGAYQGLGNTQKQWYYVRQAVLCPYKDSIVNLNFVIHCKALIIETGLSLPGTDEDEVLEKLGAPDKRIDSQDGSETILTYGKFIMEFKNNKLVSSGFDKDFL